MIKNKVQGISNILRLTLKTLFTLDINQISLLPLWLKTLIRKGEPIKDNLPRLSIGAIAWLNSYMDKTKKVFEYGSGGSTLFFAKRVKKVVSVEHNPLWHKIVLSELKNRNLTNCECHLVKPQKIKKTKELEFGSHLKEYKGMTFRDYVNEIKKHPKDKFDLVLIDGRARISCINEAIRVIKNKGYIMFDNAERKEYAVGLKLLSRYKRKDFFGPSPYLANNFVKTSIWEIVK